MADGYIDIPVEGGGGGSGTVTSVGLSASPSSVFNVSGSPVTTAGVLALSLDNQNANTVLAGPTNGAAATPAFRGLVPADIPALSYLSSTLTSAHIFVGNGSNVATDVAMTGDITISNLGVTAIGALKVTNGMLAGSIAASKLIGTDIATVGTITAGTWNGTVIGVAYGGTGLSTLTANNVILGNGTSTPTFVAPGTSGNVLTSNGTTWTSAAASGGGVSTVGTFSASAQTNGATIATSTITFGPASATVPGMVSIGTQTWAGAKTFTSTLTVDTSAGTSTGIVGTVSGATNGLLLTNLTMGATTNSIVRLVGTVTSPTTTIYKGQNVDINTGNSATSRTIYGYDFTATAGGSAATNTIGYHSNINVAQVGALSPYNNTGLFGAFHAVYGNQTTTGNGNVGSGVYVGFSNNNIGYHAQIDTAGGTTPVNCGYISNVTSSGATVTAGAFFRIGTANNQAFFDTLPTVSAGLIATNGNTTSPSLIIQDNTTTSFSVADGGDTNVAIGQLLISTAGKGLSVKEGSNAKMGQATLSTGTVTVSTTAVTTNSRIFLTTGVAGGTLGVLSVGTITNGTSFVINSSSPADSSTVNWIIIEAL